ncbi:MAG: cyclic nucleotide-binding domain-containing protein [Rhodospirillales bacterium]|nr:cyclic nucleotide-binding domain-containing protein [Rhodospirillales bacterium]
MKFRGEGVTRAAYPEGKRVFHEGEQGNAVFIIEKGSVSIVKDVDGEEVQLATLRPGELFGEMALIDGSARMASAVTAEPSVIAKIPKETFETKLKGFDPFLRALVQILINNLRGVHKAYMKRPRSAQDYINVLNHSVDGFKRYSNRVEDSDLHDAAIRRISAIQMSLSELEKLFKDHDDRRRNVVSDVDLSG